jgi:hypothetical protein
MVGQRDSDQNHRPMLLLLLQLFVFAVVNVLVILFVVFISIFDCWIKLGKFFMFVAKRGGKVKNKIEWERRRKRERIYYRGANMLHVEAIYLAYFLPVNVMPHSGLRHYVARNRAHDTP